MEILQREWAARQGFGRKESIPPAEVARRFGWLRSVGSANPYLAIHARTGASREEIERAVAEVEIVEVPAARGCTYYVSREDAAMALRLGDMGTCSAEFRMAERHLGVTDAEVRELADRILRALEGGPLDPRAISAEAAPRHLGEAGKKRGMTSTLSLGLSRLQLDGLIRRLPHGRRLDTERFRYARWENGPRPAALSEEELARGVAQRYFAWAGPATEKEFRDFTGLPARLVKVAMVDLDPWPGDSARWSLGGSSEKADEGAVLLSSLDPWIHLRRNLPTLLDPADAERRVPFGSDLRDATSLRELDSHAIVMEGVVVGLWEFDHEAQEIAAWSWRPCEAVTAAVRETSEWIARELGDFRSFSLDSPKSRSPRVQLLRSLAV